MNKKILIVITLIIALTVTKNVHAEILPSSYYSNINNNGQAYRSDLYVIVPDNYCDDNNSVWSVNVTAEVSSKCYLTENNLTFWRVQLFYTNPLPPSTTSVNLSYNHGSVSDYLIFNPFQFTVADKIEQVNFNNGKSVLIMNPPFVRSIGTIENGTVFQSIIMQESGFNTSKSYILKLVDPSTNTPVNTYKSTFYNFYNTNIILFTSTNFTRSGVYKLQIYNQTNSLVGEFLAYMGSYYVNYYGENIYIFKNLIILDNKVYIKIRNTNFYDVNVTMVNVTVLSNDLQTIFSFQNDNHFLLKQGDDKLVYLGQITSSQFNQLKTGVNIMSATVYYMVGNSVYYKKNNHTNNS